MKSNRSENCQILSNGRWRLGCRNFWTQEAHALCWWNWLDPRKKHPRPSCVTVQNLVALLQHHPGLHLSQNSAPIWLFLSRCHKSNGFRCEPNISLTCTTERLINRFNHIITLMLSILSASLHNTTCWISPLYSTNKWHQLNVQLHIYITKKITNSQSVLLTMHCADAFIALKVPQFNKHVSRTWDYNTGITASLYRVVRSRWSIYVLLLYKASTRQTRCAG